MEIYFKTGLVVSSIIFILGIFMLFNKDYYKENIDYGYNNDSTDILMHSVLYILILLSYCALMILIYPLLIVTTLFYLYHKRK